MDDVVGDDSLEEVGGLRRGRQLTEARTEEIQRMSNNAIVLLDEFDKLRICRGANTDSFCQDYQASLLRMVEGEVCNLKRSEESDVESVDTTDTMFIFLGV